MQDGGANRVKVELAQARSTECSRRKDARGSAATGLPWAERSRGATGGPGGPLRRMVRVGEVQHTERETDINVAPRPLDMQCDVIRTCLYQPAQKKKAKVSDP